MSGIQFFSMLFLLLLALGEALEVFVKVNDQFVAIPGEYRLVKVDKPTRGRRNKRQASSFEESRPVVIDGVERSVPLSRVFELYSSLQNDQARRAAFAPNDTNSFGECEVFETISWPGNCYRLQGTTFSMCRSPARGMAEIKVRGCINGDYSTAMDFFG